MSAKKVDRKYAWRSGRSFKTDAALAAQEFERIRREKGELTAQNLVDESRPEDAVCHNDFEWDDSIAGEKYRLVQSRTMLRAVVVSEPNHEPRPVNVHVVTEKTSGRYETMETVVHDVDMFSIALTALQSKMSAATRAVRELQQAAKGSKHKSKLAMVALAVKAVDAASRAVAALAK